MFESRSAMETDISVERDMVDVVAVAVTEHLRLQDHRYTVTASRTNCGGVDNLDVHMTDCGFPHIPGITIGVPHLGRSGCPSMSPSHLLCDSVAVAVAGE